MAIRHPLEKVDRNPDGAFVSPTAPALQCKSRRFHESDNNDSRPNLVNRTPRDIRLGIPIPPR